MAFTHRPSQIILASTNPGKAAEIQRVLHDMAVRIRLLNEFSREPIDEPYSTFVENALTKARYGCDASQLPCLADDSGLIVPSLDHQPGIKSARYAHPTATDKENRTKLLTALENNHNRDAYFCCAMVLLESPQQPDPFIALTTWHGHITTAEQGEGGFGYDAIFVPQGETRTAAQLSIEEKNNISHRGQALRQVRAFLQSCSLGVD